MLLCAAIILLKMIIFETFNLNFWAYLRKNSEVHRSAIIKSNANDQSQETLHTPTHKNIEDDDPGRSVKKLNKDIRYESRVIRKRALSRLTALSLKKRKLGASTETDLNDSEQNLKKKLSQLELENKKLKSECNQLRIKNKVLKNTYKCLSQVLGMASLGEQSSGKRDGEVSWPGIC